MISLRALGVCCRRHSGATRKLALAPNRSHCSDCSHPPYAPEFGFLGREREGDTAAMETDAAGNPRGSLKCRNVTAVTEVDTAKGLEEAILSNECHIVIKAHLDLTELELRSNSVCEEGCKSPLPDVRETASIRVRLSPPSLLTTAACCCAWFRCVDQVHRTPMLGGIRYCSASNYTN